MNTINFHEAKLILLNGKHKYGYVEKKSLNERLLNFTPFNSSVSQSGEHELIPITEIHSIDLAIR